MNSELTVTQAIPFVEFPKIARFSREIVISEKIDGTNGCIHISEDSKMLVGSRTQWITPQNDNHGFARWAYEHQEELKQLGVGTHFGEWWGSGIQRGYGLPKGEKRFSMFNTIRWCLHGQEPKQIKTGDPRQIKVQDVLPPCCGLVPILYRGQFCSTEILNTLEKLKESGSVAAPGFKNPEGIVIFHTAAKVAFKKTIEKDDSPKSL